MKRAFFVVGPESSGTRHLTKVLMDGGCFGDDGHVQRMDDLNFQGRPDNIVLRRSIPHARRWPNLLHIIQTMQKAGYFVTTLAMVRDQYAMARSQVRIGHVPDTDTAWQNIDRAYGQIAKLPLPMIFVPYEAGILHPQSYNALLERLELAPPEKLYIYDGNEKYYG